MVNSSIAPCSWVCGEDKPVWPFILVGEWKGRRGDNLIVYFLSVVFPKEIIRQKRCIYEVVHQCFLIMWKITDNSLVVIGKPEQIPVFQ